MKSKINIYNVQLINKLQNLTTLFIKFTYGRSDKRIVRSKQLDLPTIYHSDFVIGDRVK
jgi:hypothetical protein